VASRSGGAEGEGRLSLPLSPRRPSLRFPSPLIEPDVTIWVIRLSDGIHVKACAGAHGNKRPARRRRAGRECLHATPCRTGSGTVASAPAWPSRRALVGASESFPELLGSRQSPPLSSFKRSPEPGLLSSPVITRVHRSYEPLRRLPFSAPKRCRCQVTLTARQTSRVASHRVRTCCAHYPGEQDHSHMSVD